MNATGILQSYLDEVGAAVMAGDWEGYSSRVIMPFTLVTRETNITITTESDLRLAFDSFRATLRFQRVTDFIRLVESAAQLDTDLISGKYLTHLLAGGHRLLDPFRSQITNALANSSWTVLASGLPKPDKGPKT